MPDRKNAYIYADARGFIVSDDDGIIGEVEEEREGDVNEWMVAAIKIAKDNGCTVGHFSNDEVLKDESVVKEVKGFEETVTAGEW